MIGPGVVGAVPGAYPKTIGPINFNSFGPPDGGTRRSYNGTTDQFIDTPGWTWANGGPTASLIANGYALTMQVEANDLEANAGKTHTYRMKIAGSLVGIAAVNSTGGSGIDAKSGYLAPSPTTAAGAITFGDYVNNTETDHQGIITLSYQYTRA